jgi:hypothetical protein
MSLEEMEVTKTSDDESSAESCSTVSGKTEVDIDDDSYLPTNENEKDLFVDFASVPSLNTSEMSSDRKLKLALEVLISLKKEEEKMGTIPYKYFYLGSYLSNYGSWFVTDFSSQKICIKTRLRDSNIFLMIMCLVACYDSRYFFDLLEMCFAVLDLSTGFYEKITPEFLLSPSSRKTIVRFAKDHGLIAEVNKPQTIQHVYTLDRIEERLRHPDFLKKIMYRRNKVARYMNEIHALEQADYNYSEHYCPWNSDSY